MRAAARQMQDGVAALSAIGTKIMPPPPRLRRARVWLRKHILGPIKRSHWVFQIPDQILMRLLRQDETEKHLGQWIEQQVTLATIIRDVEQRLSFHEAGPLAKSTVELRKRRDLAARQAKNRQNGNGAKSDAPRSQPTKIIDAGGKVIELPQNPAPAEAADHDGDSDPGPVAQGDGA
jgi:hypothetical protein